MFYLPLSFSFFIFHLLHNFIIFLPQFFYSLLHNFTILIFSLLILLISIVFPFPPPPPHFYCFPSTTSLPREFPLTATPKQQLGKNEIPRLLANRRSLAKVLMTEPDIAHAVKEILGTGAGSTSSAFFTLHVELE